MITIASRLGGFSLKMSNNLVPPLATTALVLLVASFPSLIMAYVRHNPQSNYNRPASTNSNLDSRINALLLSQQNFSELVWPRSGEVTSNWGKPRASPPDSADIIDGMVPPQPIDSISRQNLADMASNNNYFFQKHNNLNNLNFDQQLMLAQAQSVINQHKLAINRRNAFTPELNQRQIAANIHNKQLNNKLSAQGTKRSMKNVDVDDDSDADPDEADDDDDQKASLKRESVSSSNNKKQLVAANLATTSGKHQPSTAVAASTNGPADLQMAAGHHHKKSHGHGHYHQYAEVPKKKSWKFGYKRGNHKHTIERHEEGHKNKFHSHVSWNAKEKCGKKKKKKCHSKGSMSWEYKHHDKKKHHGHHHG